MILLKVIISYMSLFAENIINYQREKSYVVFCKIGLIIQNALRYQGVGPQCSRVGDRGLTEGEQNEVQGKHLRGKKSLTCE